MYHRIKTFAPVVLLMALMLVAVAVISASAEQPDGKTSPTTVLYQGYVTMGGTPYDGTGYFKFAVVNAAGTTTYWSNDGTSTGGSQPSASVSRAVENGYFTVLLGETSLGGMSQTLTPSVFSGAGRHLRVWFAASASGSFTQLSLVPIAAAPYALNAETLDGLDSSALQQRVDGTCAGGSAIRAVGADGSVTCESVSDHDHWGASWSGNGTGLTLNSSDSTGGYFVGDDYGVYGEGYDLDGVRAVSTGGDLADNGVYGETNSTDTTEAGVFGYSSSQACGVLGYASEITATNVGVQGQASGIYTYTAGVFGVAPAESGYGTSGVYGRSYSDGGAGVLAHHYWYGVGLRANSYGGNIIEGWSGDPFTSFETRQFYVDNSGNLYATGTKSALVETQDYGPRRLYAIESPEVWFEDFGGGELVNGESVVTFEPIFAQTVNLAETYHVFLTPVGDEPALLFVTHKGTTGFTVQGVTPSGQPANVTFDWQVVAKRQGYENKRLESGEVKPVPVINEILPEREPSSLPPLPERLLPPGPPVPQDEGR